MFFDERECRYMGMISKKVYHKHVPVKYTVLYLRGKIIKRELEDFPPGALEKYCKDEANIKKYKMLDSAY